MGKVLLTLGALAVFLIVISGHPQIRTPPQTLDPEAEDTMTASGTTQGSTFSHLVVYGDGIGTGLPGGASGEISSNTVSVAAGSLGPGEIIVGNSNSTAQMTAASAGVGHFLQGNSTTSDVGTGSSSFQAHRTINRKFPTKMTPPAADLTAAATSGVVNGNATTSVVTGLGPGIVYGTFTTAYLSAVTATSVTAGEISSLGDSATSAIFVGDSYGAAYNDAYSAPQHAIIDNDVNSYGTGNIVIQP